MIAAACSRLTWRIRRPADCLARRFTKAAAPAPATVDSSKTYPYSFGPRIGASYQINPKTVLRGGWGITYAQTGNGEAVGGSTLGAGGWNTFNFQSPAFGEPGALLRTGLNYSRDELYRVNNNAGIRPSPGQVDSPPQWIHPDAGKMPRLNQWSISLQREITRDLVVDVAYVGNRGKGFTANNLVSLNADQRRAASNVRSRSQQRRRPDPTDFAPGFTPGGFARLQ